MRRLTLAGISTALLLAILAGCGGGSETPSPSEVAATEAPLATQAPASSPSQVVEEPTAAPAAATTMYAVCGNVAVRKGPATDQGLVVRLSKGTKVRVVDTVSGDSYDAGRCGDSGDQWLKITRIAGKSTMKQYDVEYVYAAAGFFGEGRP